jgi:hypothetical protein
MNNQTNSRKTLRALAAKLIALPDVTQDLSITKREYKLICKGKDSAELRSIVSEISLLELDSDIFSYRVKNGEIRVVFRGEFVTD